MSEQKLPEWPEPDAVGRVSNRELYEAAIARLKKLIDATQTACAELDDDCPISAARGLRYALEQIGEVPQA